MKCSLIEVTLKHSLKISFNGKPLGFLSGALRWIVSGFSIDVSGHQVGKRWGHHHRAQPTPWLPPSSYKRSPLLPLTRHSNPSSHMPLGWHLLPLASLSSFTSTVLRRSPAQDLLHHHHHYVVVLLEFPGIHYFRCPTGARGGGRHWSVRVTDYGDAALLWCQVFVMTLRSASVRLHQPRE